MSETRKLGPRIDEIQAFLSLVKSGKLEFAAKELSKQGEFVKKETVKQRIRRLEESIGQDRKIKLFEPGDSKGFHKLTHQGQLFHPQALRMLSSWERALQDAQFFSHFDSSLNVGAQFSLWDYVARRFVRDLSRKRQNIAIRMVVDKTPALVDLLIQRSIDLALIYDTSMVNRERCTVQPFVSDLLIMVANKPGLRIRDIRKNQYVYVDHGEQFGQRHQLRYPSFLDRGLPVFTRPRLFFERAGPALRYLRAAREDENPETIAAYIPYRMARRYLDSGEISVVAGSTAYRRSSSLVFQQFKSPHTRKYIGANSRAVSSANTSDKEGQDGEILYDRVVDEAVTTLMSIADVLEAESESNLENLQMGIDVVDLDGS